MAPMLTMLALLLAACGASSTPEPHAPPPAPPPVAEPAPPPPPVAVAVDLSVPTSLDGLSGNRDPNVPVERLPDLGHAQQRVLRSLAADPVAAKAVLDQIPEDLRPNLERLIQGTGSIARTVPVPKTDLPNWRIVPAKPAAELLGYYRESAEAHGVPWQILAAIHLNETRMGRLRGTSDAGAKGPMQFMPATWKAYGSGDIENDRDAVLAAGNYLREMGWEKDPDKAIWHYNHSTHYVRAIQEYAAAMEAEPRAFYALWGWQVYYRTVAGSIWLDEGYEQTERIAIEAYCGERGEPFCPDMHASARR